MENRPDPLLFLAGNPGPLTGSGNNTWLLDGAEPALIDAGVGAPAHIAALAAALGSRPLVRVLVTHGHDDHSSGAPAIRARWPSVEIYTWTSFGDSHWRPLSDGQRLRAGDVEIVVVHTPGHAPDHVCFWNAAGGDLFAGDMVAQDNTVMIPAGRGGNMREYLASLERLAALKPSRIYPGHGPVVERPVELVGAYLQHRRMREAQILECLRDGVTDIDAMIARIYPELAGSLRSAARATIEAHLEKLREEGRTDP